MKKKAIVLFVVGILCSIFIINAFSTSTIISDRYCVGNGNFFSYEMSLPVESEITIKLIGKTGDDDIVNGTTGSYKLIIMESKNTVYEVSGSTKKQDVEYKVTLAAGDYRLRVQENNNKVLYYVIKVTYKPVGKVAADSVKLNKTSVSIDKGDSYQLKATVLPKYATDKVTWKSSNTDIATVNSSGKVEGKKLGKTTVTAKAGKVYKKCTVRVNKQYVEMWANSSKSLISSIKYINNYEKAKWSTSDKSIVTVNKNGKITAKNTGVANIYCKIGEDKYTFVVYAYSKTELKNDTIKALKKILKNPKSLIVNEVSYPSVGRVDIDYSAMNGYGGYNREIYRGKYKYGYFSSY